LDDYFTTQDTIILSYKECLSLSAFNTVDMAKKMVVIRHTQTTSGGESKEYFYKCVEFSGLTVNICHSYVHDDNLSVSENPLLFNLHDTIIDTGDNKMGGVLNVRENMQNIGLDDDILKHNLMTSYNIGDGKFIDVKYKIEYIIQRGNWTPDVRQMPIGLVPIESNNETIQIIENTKNNFINFGTSDEYLQYITPICQEVGCRFSVFTENVKDKKIEYIYELNKKYCKRMTGEDEESDSFLLYDITDDDTEKASLISTRPYVIATYNIDAEQFFNDVERRANMWGKECFDIFKFKLLKNSNEIFENKKNGIKQASGSESGQEETYPGVHMPARASLFKGVISDICSHDSGSLYTTVALPPVVDGQPTGSSAPRPPSAATPAASGTVAAEAGPASPVLLDAAPVIQGGPKRSKVNLARQQAANASLSNP